MPDEKKLSVCLKNAAGLSCCNEVLQYQQTCVVNSVKIIILLVRARDQGAILVLVPGL